MAENIGLHRMLIADAMLVIQVVGTEQTAKNVDIMTERRLEQMAEGMLNTREHRADTGKLARTENVPDTHTEAIDIMPDRATEPMASIVEIAIVMSSVTNPKIKDTPFMQPDRTVESPVETKKVDMVDMRKDTMLVMTLEPKDKILEKTPEMRDIALAIPPETKEIMVERPVAVAQEVRNDDTNDRIFAMIPKQAEMSKTMMGDKKKPDRQLVVKDVNKDTMLAMAPKPVAKIPVKHIEPNAVNAERMELREIAPDAGAEPIPCACTRND